MPSFMAQIVVGGALGVGGLFAGGYLGYKLDCGSDCHRDFAGFRGLLLGAAIGLTVATTTGVTLMGTDDEHNSAVGFTWVGSIIGGAAGLVAAAKVSDSLAATSVLLASGSALGGTLLFYAARTRKRPASGLRLVPFTSGKDIGVALVGYSP
jgi:VIT1/CCC1 family predicted Fe2+/Mn2+ transporter